VAGLEEVPVIVHKAKFKDEDQALRIVENLKRRTVTIDEAIKAVKELDLIYSSAEFVAANKLTVSGATGYSAHRIAKLRTLADLVPALSQLLKDNVITQHAAYQLAQLPEEDQKAEDSKALLHGASSPMCCEERFL
jgi:ParB-like chromosome segregation protein Spo0J